MIAVNQYAFSFTGLATLFKKGDNPTAISLFWYFKAMAEHGFELKTFGV